MAGEGLPTERRDLQVLVHGRVQGVFYRQFARSQAQRLGLVGWVRNLPDGSTVKVVAQGPRNVLEELLAHLRQGPPEAWVSHVDIEWSAPGEELRSFQVRG